MSNDKPEEIEAKSFGDVISDLEEKASQGPDISELASQVLTAARLDWAHGDETYDPSVAAENGPWSEEELEEASEELVEHGLFEKEGDVYKLEEMEDE